MGNGELEFKLEFKNSKNWRIRYAVRGELNVQYCWTRVFAQRMIHVDKKRKPMICGRIYARAQTLYFGLKFHVWCNFRGDSDFMLHCLRCFLLSLKFYLFLQIMLSNLMFITVLLIVDRVSNFFY